MLTSISWGEMPLLQKKRKGPRFMSGEKLQRELEVGGAGLGAE